MIYYHVAMSSKSVGDAVSSAEVPYFDMTCLTIQIIFVFKFIDSKVLFCLSPNFLIFYIYFTIIFGSKKDTLSAEVNISQILF